MQTQQTNQGYFVLVMGRKYSFVSIAKSILYNVLSIHSSSGICKQCHRGLLNSISAMLAYASSETTLQILVL